MNKLLLEMAVKLLENPKLILCQLLPEFDVLSIVPLSPITTAELESILRQRRGGNVWLPGTQRSPRTRKR